MASLKDRLKADLTTSMKARDELTKTVLRSALAAVKEARVAGDGAHELSDDDVRAILAKEAKRRDEAAAAFADGGPPSRPSASGPRARSWPGTCPPHSPATS